MFSASAKKWLAVIKKMYIIWLHSFLWFHQLILAQFFLMHFQHITIVSWNCFSLREYVQLGVRVHFIVRSLWVPQSELWLNEFSSILLNWSKICFWIASWNIHIFETSGPTNTSLIQNSDYEKSLTEISHIPNQQLCKQYRYTLNH